MIFLSVFQTSRQEETSGTCSNEMALCQNSSNAKSDESKDLCDSGAANSIEEEPIVKKVVPTSSSDTSALSSPCCNTSRQLDGRESCNNDNLDMAMLKLESMRLNDSKNKRRQSTNNGKRVVSLTKDVSEDVKKDASRSQAKSPTTTLSPLASTAPSKARKRRSKKRLKTHQNGNQSDDGGGVSNSCKSPSSEITTETTTSKTTTCDSSNKNIEFCRSRTNAKDTKHSTRNRTSDSEKPCLDSRENNRLRYEE